MLTLDEEKASHFLVMFNVNAGLAKILLALAESALAVSASIAQGMEQGMDFEAAGMDFATAAFPELHVPAKTPYAYRGRMSSRCRSSTTLGQQCDPQCRLVHPACKHATSQLEDPPQTLVAGEVWEQVHALH